MTTELNPSSPPDTNPGEQPVKPVKPAVPVTPAIPVAPNAPGDDPIDPLSVKPVPTLDAPSDALPLKTGTAGDGGNCASAEKDVRPVASEHK